MSHENGFCPGRVVVSRQRSPDNSPDLIRLPPRTGNPDMQLHATLVCDPHIRKAGWAAARMGDHLDVVIDGDLPPRLRAMALLEALTDDEYFEIADATLSGLPRQRVAELIREPA